MSSGQPRILLIRLSAIGDVVRCIPAFEALRHAYPEARIDWAVERKSAAVVEGLPGLNTVWVYERSRDFVLACREFLRLCREVRRQKYDYVVDFHGLLKSGVLALASGAPERIGFARPRAQEGSHLCANRRVSVPLNELNRVEENLRLSDMLAPRPQEFNVSIAVPADTQTEIDAFLERNVDGSRKLVAMHAPVERPEKQWPLAHFAELADELMDDGRFSVLLTWGPGQYHVVEDIMRQMRRRPAVAPETPTLKHVAWLMKRADLYFGGDTGPMHIAWNMGTPVVAVFGGTNPAQHAPPGQQRIILYEAEPAARPGPPARAAARLEAITPGVAYEACVRLAMEGPVDAPSLRDEDVRDSALPPGDDARGGAGGLQQQTHEIARQTQGEQ